LLRPSEEIKLRSETSLRSFNPATLGTAESRWESSLGGAPRLILPEAGILIVSPHPDDETLGAGGLIRTASTRAHTVSVLSVTDGESAYPDWKGLDKVRRRETSRALSILSSYPLTIKRLGIPDGRVSAHRSALYDAIDRMATATTLLVAPYELDGHPDHEATGEVCLEVAHRRNLAIWRYPIWMWHHGSPDLFKNPRWGRFWLDGDTRRAKDLAIECFESQLRPSKRPPIIPAHVLPYFARPYEAFLV
jgi:LmbE family N-acetylglucosaminyl deacetylase